VRPVHLPSITPSNATLANPVCAEIEQLGQQIAMKSTILSSRERERERERERPLGPVKIEKPASAQIV